MHDSSPARPAGAADRDPGPAEPPRAGERPPVPRVETSQDRITLLDLDGAPVPVGGEAGRAWPGLGGEAQETARAALAEALAGRTARFEAEAAGPDGASVRWEVTVSPVPGPDGRPERLLAVSRDVTGRRRAEDGLRRAFEQAERAAAERAAILGQLAEGVIVADVRGRITLVNEAASRLHGVAALDVTPERYSEAYRLFTEEGEPYPPRALPLARAALDGETVTEARWRIRRPDGTEILAIGSASPVHGPDGTRIGAVLTLHDDTRRHATEQALAASEARLRDLLATLDLGAFMARDWEGTIRFWSEGCARLYGWSAAEALGRPAHALLRTEFPTPRAEIEAALESVGEWTGDLCQRTRDGAEIIIAARKAAHRDAAGRLVAVLETVTDVTAHRRAEAALREESHSLETLNRTGAALAGELDVERLVQRVTDAGVELTGARFGAYFHNVMDETGKRLHLYTLSGADRAAFEGLGRPRATAVFGPTFRNEGIIRSDDILADPRYGQSEPHRGMPAGHLPVRSYLAVPVVARSGEVLGGLLFGHPEPGRFTERHERLMVGLAAQAAVALDNARLFQAAQRELEERRQAEERLRASEARFEAIANSIDQLIWSTRPDGHHDYYNQRWYEYTGVPEGSTDGEAWSGLFHPDDRERAWAAWRHSLATGERYQVEYRLRHRSGQYRWVIGRAQCVRDEAGRIARWFGTCTDVHDLKTAEAKLMRANALLGAVMEAVPGVVYAKDRAGRMLTANRGTIELVGKPLREIVGHTDLEFLDDKAQAEAVMANDRRVMERNRAETLEEVVSGPDGSVRVWLSHKAPFRDAGGAVIGLVGASMDITERKRAEERLRQSNETLEARVAERTADRDRMWRLSTDLMLVARFDATITAVNPAWRTLLGWREEELIGTSFLDLVHPDDRAATLAEAARLEAGLTTLRFENRFRGREGGHRWLSWTAVPDESFIHAVARDITADRERQAELERAQEALRQSQKMETVGQLTGGIAHDFNNLLQIVTGNLEILQRNLPAESPRLRRAADNAMTGARRAATLTQRLLAFSRRQPLSPKPINVNQLVSGMSELLHRTLGETVALETVLAGGLWRVEADPNQLENALLNLAVNARDAMPEGGKLTIETSNTHLDRAYTAQNAEVAPGQYVVICVSDTGTGMDEATMARVFEPFFTTKEVGKGTGLGLSMVYGFVKQSGGHVKIYSEIGHGTTVKVYLPRLHGPAEEEDESTEILVPEGTRDETILVCEDDDDVRAYSVEVLRELGYRVLEAHDGPSALRLLERQEGRVELLFSDVVLPGGMTGADLAARARRLRPDLKVLFTTGYARDAIVHHGRLDPGVALITKPFTYADLAARVRDTLDGNGR